MRSSSMWSRVSLGTLRRRAPPTWVLSRPARPMRSWRLEPTGLARAMPSLVRACSLERPPMGTSTGATIATRV